jgi:hypothetical protein
MSVTDVVTLPQRSDVRFEDRPNHFLKGAKFASLRAPVPACSGDSMDTSLFPLVTPRDKAITIAA